MGILSIGVDLYRKPMFVCHRVEVVDCTKLIFRDIVDRRDAGKKVKCEFIIVAQERSNGMPVLAGRVDAWMFVIQKRVRNGVTELFLELGRDLFCVHDFTREE